MSSSALSIFSKSRGSIRQIRVGFQTRDHAILGEFLKRIEREVSEVCETYSRVAGDSGTAIRRHAIGDVKLLKAPGKDIKAQMQFQSSFMGMILLRGSFPSSMKFIRQGYPRAILNVDARNCSSKGTTCGRLATSSVSVMAASRVSLSISAVSGVRRCSRACRLTCIPSRAAVSVSC